ncbi:MAG TPA: type II secretion system protein GspM [Acidimicrobiales bacterium]|nr:type II secretion system protein GspM [Acidimicrobiales bacterium]
MRRWRIFLAGAGVALLLIGGYFVGFHQPRGDEIVQLSAEADQLRARQAALRQENRELEGVAARAGEFQAALARLQQLIPSRLTQDRVLEQLQADAAAAGVELVSVTFGDPQVPDGAPPSDVPGTVVVEMAVTVMAEGPYAGISNLLQRVEGEADRALLVNTVAVTEAEAGFPLVTGTWSGQAFALLSADDPLVQLGEPPTGAAAAPPQETS